MSHPAAATQKTPPRVLAIHAHPDDVEFQCAGTLALLKERGCPISIVTMTAGDKGSATMGQAEIAAVRRKEAQDAANLLGAEYLCLEFHDLEIVHDNPSRRKVVEALRRTRPDIVLTAPPVDYMSDHEVTSLLVRDACFAGSVPNYATYQWEPAPLLERIPALYYVSPLEGIDWYHQPQPYDFIVDITRTFELKQKMLACHSSQRDWLYRQHGVDEYLDSCQRWSATLGQKIGVTYGESYRQHTGHPFPQNNILKDWLS